MPRVASLRTLAVSLVPLLVACGGTVSSTGTPIETDAGSDATPLDTGTIPPADTGVDAPAETSVRPAACFGDAGADPSGDAGAPTTCLLVAPSPGPSDGGLDASDGGDGGGGTVVDPTVYPAFALDAPKLITHGGRIVRSPKIVTITWSDDGDASTLEAFVDAIGGSKYWNQVACEYGIGPAVSGTCNHVHLPGPAPATLTDSQAALLIRKNAAAWQTSGWPKPDDDTIYLLLVSDSTDYQLHTTSGLQSICGSGTGGYHTSTNVTGFGEVAYAVVPRCYGLDSTTVAVSHELAEAATDPVPTNAAYRDFDDAHAIWNAFVVGQTENGDACEFYRDADYQSSELGGAAQRQWSNASIASGHAPCVPSDGKTWFGAAPLDLQDVQWSIPDFGAGSATGPVTTKGVNIKVGETGTFTVGFYSDAPMSADFTLKVIEGSALRASGMSFSNNKLVISVDKTTGRNGTIATVTVKVNGTDATLGANMVTLVTTDPTNKQNAHYWPVLITSN
jgi:hypothetical protein